MDRLASAKQKLQGSRLPQAKVGLCVRVVEFLEELPPEQAVFLTVPDFSSTLDGEQDVNELVSALSILSTFEDAPLTAHAYLDGPEGEFIPIPDEDFVAMLSTGELVHPDFGEPVERPLNHVRLYYRLEG